MILTEFDKEARDLMDRIFMVNGPEHIKEILRNYSISFSNGKYRSALFQQIERIKKGYIGEKNRARNRHDFHRVEEIAEKIRRLRLIQKMTKNVYLTVEEDSFQPEIIRFSGSGKRRNMPKLSLPREALKKLDLYSSIDLSSRLEDLFQIKDPEIRKESLREMQEHYRQVQRNISEYIGTEKGTLIRDLDDPTEITELLEGLRENKQVSETIIEYLERSISFESSLLHESDRQQSLTKMVNPELYLNHEEKQIYQLLIAGQSIDLLQNRALRVFKVYLKYGPLDQVDQSITEFGTQLFDQVSTESLDRQYEIYCSILDTLRGRIYNENQLLRNVSSKTEMDVEAANEKKTIDKTKKSLDHLNRFKNVLLDKVNFCKLALDPDFLSPEEKADRKVIWDMAKYFMKNPLCYYHINALVDTFPEILSTVDEEERTLLEQIVMNYISNYQTMLANHSSDYIHPDYYQTIFISISNRLFQKGQIEPLLANSKEYQLLSTFLDQVDRSKYNFERKGAASKSTRKMLEAEIFSGNKTNSLDRRTTRPEISPDLLESFYYMKEIALSNCSARSELRYNHLKNLPMEVESVRSALSEEYQTEVNLDTVLAHLQIKKSDYTNSLLNSKTFALGDVSHLYSVHTLPNGEYFLRMHVLDLTSCMEENSPLAQYLYDASFTSKDELLNKYFSPEYFLGEETPLPAITYQVKVSSSGKIGSFHSYQSNIQVDEVIQSLEDYREDDEKKRMVGIYRILSQDLEMPRIDSIRQIFDQTINYSALVYATTRELPVIATGISTIPEEEKSSLQANLCEEFFKMTKSTFQKSYSIINTNWDPEHFVNGVYTEGVYTASIFNPKSYIDYFNQRLLLASDCNLSKETLGDYRDESDMLVRTFNHHQGYVGRREFDRKENFQKRKKAVGSTCQPIVKNSQNSCNFQ